jgi:hypothetical protein
MLCLLLLCSAFSVAEQPMVRRDTQFPVQLRSETATATAKPGAALEFLTTESVLIGNGVVVPRGAQIFGRVEEVRSGSLAAGGRLRVSIDTLQWNRWSAPLNAVVVGVEPSDADDNPVWRHLHRAVRGRRTMLEHIGVRSHVGRKAFVDFESDRGNFTLRRGVRLVLWQVDPERDPVMFAKNPVLEVRSPAK